MPYGVNSVLYTIVDAYNKQEVKNAKKESRKAEDFIIIRRKVSHGKISDIT